MGIASLMAGVLLFTQALFPNQPAIAAETERGRMYASLWQERRAARQTKQAEPLLAWAGPQSAILPPLERAADIVRATTEIPALLRHQSGLPTWTHSLPLAWAEVQAVHVGGATRPWVVLIEDLHNQEEAQRNIARVLGYFGAASGSTPFPVAIEGGSGPYDFSPFLRAGPPEAVRRAADHFLKKGWISGAQFAGLTAEHAPVFSGAEDPALYQANIEAFQSSRPLLPKTESALAESRRWLADQKGKEFSEKARALDEARTRFQAGTLNVKDYLSNLAGLSPVQPSGNLARFLDLTRSEATLNFAAVERERADLLGNLSRRLDRRSMETLSTLAVAYRAGEISYGTIYGRIETLAKSNGVMFGPAFRDYLNYLVKADAIDRRAFLEELSAYEDKTAQSVLKTEAERVLWRQCLEWTLADKLVHQNLSASEWADYKVLAVRSCPIYRASLPSERSSHAVQRRPINGATTGAKDVRFSGRLDPKQLEPFETFYQVAIRRNESLADGLKRAVAKGRIRTEVPAGILVAGGFHTAGLTEALDKQGFNVLTLAPKIKTLNGEHYMAAFTRDRSPLDRILVGEKLFLATPQTLGQAPAAVPAAYREEAVGRSDYFTQLVSALAMWSKGQAEIHLANGKRLLVLMGEKAQALAGRMKGYVEIDRGPQLVVLAKRATALAVGLGMAVAVVTAHESAWNKQMDGLGNAANRIVRTLPSVRRDKTKIPARTDFPALLKENMVIRKQLMEAVDVGNKEEAYRLYDTLSGMAANLSEAAHAASETDFETAWFSFSPHTKDPLSSERIKEIRLELIEQGLTEFPNEQKKQLHGLVEQLVDGMFAGDSRKDEVREKLEKSLTPGQFSVVFSKKLLDIFFEVFEEYRATRDPQRAEALSSLGEKIGESLDPLRTFHRLGSVIRVDGGRLALKSYLTPHQTGHVFMHEVIHLGGYQGWLQIPWTAEHFPHANQILFLFKTYGVEALSDPALLSEMGLPIRQLFERGRRMGEKGELGFLILPGASGDNFNYFSNAPLLNEATGVLSMSGENIDKLLDPYMAQRATGIVLAGVLAGRAVTDPNFQPLATMRGLYESLHERLGPPTEDEKRFVEETTGFLSKVAKGIAGASNVKMVPKPGGGTWSAHRSKDYSCTIQYVPSDLYPRGPGPIQVEKEKVRSRGLAHILWAVEGPLHERHDLRDRSPLLTTERFTPKIPAFHALWKALSFREMVAGLTDWHGRDVHSFSQMEDMAGAPKWMHELFQHRYQSGNEEYDRLLLSNLTSSEQFLDVLMYLRVHYQGGDLSLSDPRLTNPQVHAALAESLGSMTSEGESGWGRVLFDDGFFNKDGLHSAIAQRIWPAFDKLFEEDIKRKTLQKALAKMLQDRQQELNEQQRESFRQAIFENIDNQELKELLDFLKQLGVVEQEQLGHQAREEMNRKIEQFADNMQRDLLGEESSEPRDPGDQSQSPGEGQESSGKGSLAQGSSQGPTSPGKDPQGTETRGAGSSSSASSPASLKEAIEKLSENLSSLEKKLSDLGQKAQGLGEEARGLGNAAGSPQQPEGAEALVEDGKTIQEGVHGLQEQGRELARGVRDAREQTAKDAAGLPAPGSAKATEDALDLAGEQADALLGKLQEIQQKANDLADLAHRLAKSLNTGDATLPRDQAAALQDIAKELEKSLNALGRQGPAHALEKALEKAREAVKQLGKTIESIPPPSEPTGSLSEGTPSPQNTAEGESGTPTETSGQPKVSGEARSGAVELKPFELDAAPTSPSLWGDAPPTAPRPVDKATKTIGFSGFGDNDFVDVKTIFPGLTEAESEEYIKWRAPHRKLLEEVVRVVPQLLHWTEGAEIRGGKFHGMLTDIVEALTVGSGRAMVEPSKPLALKFTVLVDRSGSMDSEEKQQTVQFLLLVLAEIAFALQKSVPRGAEYRDLFQFTIGFHDTEEEHLITHRTSSKIRQNGISKESVIYKLLKSAEAQGGTELADHVKKYHDDLSGFQSKGTQGDSPPRKILIVTSDMEVSDGQFKSLGKKIKENVDEKNARRKVLTILVPTGKNDYATKLKASVGNSSIVLDAKPYKSLLRNILTVFAAGLDPKVSVNPETMARVGLEKLQRQLFPRAMSGGFSAFYAPLIKRGWHKSAAAIAALLESGPVVAVGNLLGLGWIFHSIYFVLIHLGKPLTVWATDANGSRVLVPTPFTLSRWPLVLLFGILGAALHVWGVDFLWELVSPYAGTFFTSTEMLPYTKAAIAVFLHSVYNLFTPGYLGMAGSASQLKPFGDYKNFFIRERGGLEYLVYKDDIEELQWQRAPDPTRPGVSVPQEPIENIPDNEQTLKEILKRNFISGAIYMLKSEDGRRWFRPGSGAEMEYWEQDDQDEWRQKETFSRGKRPQLSRMDSDGRAHFANGETSLAWSWISGQPETLLIRENGGTDKPVTGWNGDKPRTLELKKISDDVILAFSADELKPTLFRLVRQGDGWRVAESFLLDFKERRENFTGLIGPTGVGKEKFLKAFGQLMNLPVDIQSGHDKMQGDELLYETRIGRPEELRQTEAPSVIARALYHGGIGVLDEEKMVRGVPKDALLSVLANGTIVTDRDAKPVFQSPWGRFMTTANYDQENIGTATTGEKAIAWQSRHELVHIAPARPEQEMAWQIGKAQSRFRRTLSTEVQKTIGQLVKVATLLRLKGWGFHPTAQSPTITEQEGGVSTQWRRCLLGEGGDRMVPALAVSDRLSRAPSPRVVEHMVQHFAAFPRDFAHRKWSVVRRYFNYDADDAPPGQYETEVKVRFEREGFVDDQSGEEPPLTKRSFEYAQRDGRHFLKLTPRTPTGDPDPRWDPVDLEIFEGSWILSGAFDAGMERWIELPENRLRLYKALQGWSLGLPLLFVGEPSSGKSRLAELLQNLVGGESPQITVNKETMPHNLFYETVMGPKGSPRGVTVQKPRPILDAGLKGGACLIDEAHLLSQTMQGAFNNALSSGFYNLDGVLYRMPYLIFNMNEPDENYSALNAAFEERMDSQRFLPLSVEKIKSQLPVPEIGGELFNDRLIGEKETDDQGQIVPQRDGQPHFRGLLGVMDYIRHHPEDFPRLLYLREFNRLVLNLAHNETRGLETALGQVAQGVKPWRLPQRKLFEIIRDGCRWPEGTAEQMAEWDKALINAMADAGLWNPEAEGDPSKDGLLIFLNGEGLFIRDFPIVHTPDLEDTNLRPIRDGLLFLQRRTRGTRVQAELSNLWDHLTSLESRWASLSFSDRMTEVHVLREIHTTAGEIVKARRGQHLPETITELERLQAGIRNFLFSPPVGWPAAALEPTLERDPWLKRHSLPTPGQLTLDDLLGKTQVFPADSENAPRWVQQASETLLEAAREGTLLLQNNLEKGKAKNIPELAESYLEPLAALERSLRSAPDAAPGLADAVAKLQNDIRTAMHERRSQVSVIDDLARRLAEFKGKVLGVFPEPHGQASPKGEWTRETLLEHEVSFLSESNWFKDLGFEIHRLENSGEISFELTKDGGHWIRGINSPLVFITQTAKQAAGENWQNGPRNQITGELVHREQALVEAKIRWIQKQMIKILIREGKVSVDGRTDFEWGALSEPDINLEGTHAVIANQRGGGQVDYLVLTLNHLNSGVLSAQTLHSPIMETRAPAVFFDNIGYDPTQTSPVRIAFGTIYVPNKVTFVSVKASIMSDESVILHNNGPFALRGDFDWPETDLNPISVNTWAKGMLLTVRKPENGVSFFFMNGEDGSGELEQWTMENMEHDIQRKVPAWVGDVMREALKTEGTAARSFSALDSARRLPAQLVDQALSLGQDISGAVERAIKATTPSTPSESSATEGFDFSAWAGSLPKTAAIQHEGNAVHLSLPLGGRYTMSLDPKTRIITVSESGLGQINVFGPYMPDEEKAAREKVHVLTTLSMDDVREIRFDEFSTEGETTSVISIVSSDGEKSGHFGQKKSGNETIRVEIESPPSDPGQAGREERKIGKIGNPNVLHDLSFSTPVKVVGSLHLNQKILLDSITTKSGKVILATLSYLGDAFSLFDNTDPKNPKFLGAIEIPPADTDRTTLYSIGLIEETNGSVLVALGGSHVHLLEFSADSLSGEGPHGQPISTRTLKAEDNKPWDQVHSVAMSRSQDGGIWVVSGESSSASGKTDHRVRVNKIQSTPTKDPIQPLKTFGGDSPKSIFIEEDARGRVFIALAGSNDLPKTISFQDETDLDSQRMVRLSDEWKRRSTQIDLVLTPHGKPLFAWATKNGFIELRLLDDEEGSTRLSFNLQEHGHSLDNNVIALHSDSNGQILLAVGGADGMVTVFDITTPMEPKKISQETFTELISAMNWEGSAGTNLALAVTAVDGVHLHPVSLPEHQGTIPFAKDLGPAPGTEPFAQALLDIFLPPWTRLSETIERAGGAKQEPAGVQLSTLTPFPVLTMDALWEGIGPFIDRLKESADSVQNSGVYAIFGAFDFHTPGTSQALRFGLPEVMPKLAKPEETLPSVALKEISDLIWGPGWMGNSELDSSTGELTNPPKAAMQAEIRRLQREEIKILIRQGKVHFDVGMEPEWGITTEPTLITQWYAVIMNRAPGAANAEAIRLDLNTLGVNSINGELTTTPRCLDLKERFTGTLIAGHTWPGHILQIEKSNDGVIHARVGIQSGLNSESYIFLEDPRFERNELPQWIWDVIDQAMAFNGNNGLGALNTPPAQAPPLGTQVASILPILEEGLQPLVDIQALHRFLTGHPGAPDQAPSLLTTLLGAVSAVATTASAPPATARPKSNVELWDDLADFFASLNKRTTPDTGGKNVLVFAGVQDLTLKKSPDGTSYELRYWTELENTPTWIPPFVISQTNPLAPLLAVGRAVGGDQFNVGSWKRKKDRPMDPLLGAILIKLQELEHLILLDLIQRGRVVLDEQMVNGEIGGLTANNFLRLTRVFPGSEYGLGPTEHYLTDRVELKDGRAYFIKFDFLTCTGEKVNAQVISRGTPSQPAEIETKTQTSGSTGVIELIGTAAPGLLHVLEKVLAAVNNEPDQPESPVIHSEDPSPTFLTERDLWARVGGFFEEFKKDAPEGSFIHDASVTFGPLNDQPGAPDVLKLTVHGEVVTFMPGKISLTEVLESIGDHLFGIGWKNVSGVGVENPAYGPAHQYALGVDRFEAELKEINHSATQVRDHREELWKRIPVDLETWKRNAPPGHPIKSLQVVFGPPEGSVGHQPDILKISSSHFSESPTFDSSRTPLEALEFIAGKLFGADWRNGPRSDITGDLLDSLQAEFEAGFRWYQEQWVKILIQEGKVSVYVAPSALEVELKHSPDLASNFQWGSVVDVDISLDGTHAIVCNSLKKTKTQEPTSHLILFDLGSMKVHGATAYKFERLSHEHYVYRDLDITAPVFFQNFTPERILKDQGKSWSQWKDAGVKEFGYRAVSQVPGASQDPGIFSNELFGFDHVSDYSYLEPSRPGIGKVFSPWSHDFGKPEIARTWPQGAMVIAKMGTRKRVFVWTEKDPAWTEWSLNELRSYARGKEPFPTHVRLLMERTLLPAATRGGPAQTVATLKGWIALQKRLQRWFGQVPGWLRGSMAEAVYTAWREMEVYWGGFLLVGGIVGVVFPLGWGAVFLAGIGFGVNSFRFRADHPNQGKDLGIWFPLMWNLRYTGAVLVLAFGGVFMGGIALVVLGLVRHVLYDAPRLTKRDNLLENSMAQLNDLTSVRIEFPAVAEEVRRVSEHFEPQEVVTFGPDDVKFGASVLKQVFNAERPLDQEAGRTRYIGNRLVRALPEDGAKLMEQYEGSLGVLAALNAGMTHANIPWSKALAPVLAIRRALGLNGMPRGAVLGLQFHQFVQNALMSPNGYPAGGPLDLRAPVIVDISSLIDPEASDVLKKKIAASLAEIFSRNNGARFIITANGGTKKSVEMVWRQYKFPFGSRRMTFLNPALVSVNGIIDGVRLTDILHRRLGNLFSNAPTSDDIRFNLITDDMGRFVGLSPQQILDLVLITLQATIQITRQQFEEGLKRAGLTLIAA